MKAILTTGMLAGLLALVVPMFADIHIYAVVTIVLISIMFGQAWNLLGGFTGQISFGHAMFFGLGAYVAMIGAVRGHLDMGLGLLLGGLSAGLYSIPIGALIFRLRGPYFALGSLALAEIMRIVAVNWKSITNGGEGMPLSGVNTMFGIPISSKQEYFYMAVVLAALFSLFCSYLMKSKTGYSMIAIRENEESAQAMGIHTPRYKSSALFISAFLTGTAGAFFGFYNKFIDPDMVFSTHISTEMIFVTVIGGIGTIAGPIAGSAILVVLQEYLKGIPALQTYPSLYLTIYGFLLMIVILYLPGGIADGIKRLYRRFFRGTHHVSRGKEKAA